MFDKKVENFQQKVIDKFSSTCADSTFSDERTVWQEYGMALDSRMYELRRCDN